MTANRNYRPQVIENVQLEKLYHLQKMDNDLNINYNREDLKLYGFSMHMIC